MSRPCDAKEGAILMFGKLNILLILAIAACLGMVFFLRRDTAEPNYELVTERQMARSPAFGAYDPNANFPDGMTFRQPVANTIPRNWEPFNYGPSPVESARAGKELKNPLSPGNPQAHKLGALLY